MRSQARRVSAAPAWTPALDGAERERALDAALEIGHVLRSSVLAELTIDPRDADPSLSRGLAGAGVTFSYLAEAFDDETFQETAVAALEAAVAATARQRLLVGLMQGFTGVAWAAEHIAQRKPELLHEDANQQIDDALIRLLERGPFLGDYDLVSGLVGIGIYGRERLSRFEGERILSLVVAQLARRAEDRADGTTWFTPPRFVPASKLGNVPNGYYNLGMAHGVPGVVALLAACAQSGTDRDIVEELAAKAIAWVAANHLPPSAPSTWPFFVGPGIEPAPSRLAWCYGDPGVVSALDLAGRAFGRREWLELATSASEKLLARAPRDAGVHDVSLCHGSAGLAHLFARLSNRTADERFRAKSRLWLSVTLDKRRAGEGLAGYSVWEPEADPPKGVAQGPGLLAGVAGVVLSLLAGATEIEPEWDRMMLLS